MVRTLSENAVFLDMDNLGGSDGEPARQDIGGTNAQTDWSTIANFAAGCVYTVIGTWNGSDDLDEFKVQSSDDTSGSNTVEVTSDASGGNYDTDAPLDADGDFVIADFRNEDVDGDNANPQLYVRVYVAEAGNSGADQVASVLVKHGYQYPRKELQGAATTGSKVYVNPNS